MGVNHLLHHKYKNKCITDLIKQSQIISTLVGLHALHCSSLFQL